VVVVEKNERFLFLSLFLFVVKKGKKMNESLSVCFFCVKFQKSILGILF